MSEVKQEASALEYQTGYPLHISYESLLWEQARDSKSYSYEVACSILYPASGHLSLKVTSHNTYRSKAVREIPFTRYEAGATAYVELAESEQLEVRIVAQDGTYAKANYYAHDQRLVELNSRRIASTIERVE